MIGGCIPCLPKVWVPAGVEGEMALEKIEIRTPGIEVRPLSGQHLGPIIELMNTEGWYYYDRRELERYLSLGQDCFSLVDGSRVIGCLFTTDYGNQAWLGNILVAREYRSRGIAADLIRGVVSYLVERKNISAFRLGSVPLAIGLYKKIGFRAESFVTAQEADLPIRAEFEVPDSGRRWEVVQLRNQDLPAVAELDQRFFKSNRLSLLTSLYEDSIQEACLGLKDRGELVGFLMVRRRQVARSEAGLAEGPEHAYRLGPACVLPQSGLDGFKLLFQQAIRAVNREADLLQGSARMSVVFPKNAAREEIYADTRELAEALGMDKNLDLDRVFDEHAEIFGGPPPGKSLDQAAYMKSLGFEQEYFEQVMSFVPPDAAEGRSGWERASSTKADPEGIFATATPGDKA